MKLLFENTCPKDTTFNDISVIVEQANAKQPAKLKIKGLYIACDVTNVNGRWYDFNYFEESVIPEYRKIWIEPMRAYAELNHAQSHIVNPKDACEIITSLTPEGKNYVGESIVLNSDSRFGTPGTPNGDILAAILMHGGKIGKSTRGAVDDPNNKIINKDNQYALITIDTVLDPSGPGCYVNDVVMEQKDYMVDEHGIVVECAYNSLEKKLDDYVSTPDVDKKKEYMFNAFQEFLNDIKTK
jgi:hypothetical protein